MKIRWTIQMLHANGWERVSWYARWFELRIALDDLKVLRAGPIGIEYRLRLRRIS